MAKRLVYFVYAECVNDVILIRNYITLLFLKILTFDLKKYLHK